MDLKNHNLLDWETLSVSKSCRKVGKKGGHEKTNPENRVRYMKTRKEEMPKREMRNN